MNQLKAAATATPVKRVNGYGRAASNSPKTPQSQASRGKENDDDGGFAIVHGNSMTPMKRVPILANFEEWMKMATDNKINAANSWNFALIDYFHDMSLLKEGDSVNFQKASCTLDGCVKIYTSRVDSVATETGKLLSGLANSGSKQKNQAEGDEEDGGEGEEGDVGEDGLKRRAKRKVDCTCNYIAGTNVTQAQRSSEATLVPSFTSLQLKKFELEFSVDPLFKKASADFDEGGAKGLLLNHLSIDASGRIVFDSSDDAGDATVEGDTMRKETDALPEDEIAVVLMPEKQDSLARLQEFEFDVNALGSKFFPNLAKLDNQDICPSLKNFDLGGPAGSLDIPFLKAPDDWRQEKENAKLGRPGDKSGIFLDDDNAAGFDDDDGILASFTTGEEAGFGEGGEAWANGAAIDLQAEAKDEEFDTGEGFGNEAGAVASADLDIEGGQYVISLRHHKAEGYHQDILNYFDNALQKNWAGPEHWRIRRMKDMTKATGQVATKRKEKEPFEVNFLSALSAPLAELIYTPASSNATISMPKTQWKSKTRNLLPDDKHFNSYQLLQLFLKPTARMGPRRSGFDHAQGRNNVKKEMPESEIDEVFWARKENAMDQLKAEPQGNYDANFFQDDGVAFPGGVPDDDDDFADARESFSPGFEGDVAVSSQDAAGIVASQEANQEGAFGTQLVTQSRRLRPEYVQYARVAKKVDVRRLKEEMWRGIGFEKVIAYPIFPRGQNDQALIIPAKGAVSRESLVPETPQKQDREVLQFTSIMNNLQQVYPKQIMADISTSYCFICLLHLANEKGLTLGNETGLEELSIRKDFTAEVMEVAD